MKPKTTTIVGLSIHTGLTFCIAILGLLSFATAFARGANTSTNIVVDGVPVEILLTGAGTFSFASGQGSIQSIVLDGVTSRSALSVIVKKAGKTVTIQNLTAYGSLESITAGSVNLSGGAMTVTGELGRAKLASLSNLMVTIGPQVPTNKTVLSELTVSDAIDNAVMTINGSVGRLTAGQIIDSWVFAGYTPATLSNVMAGGTFVHGLQIQSLTLTKAVPRNSTNSDYVNSVVAADRIGAIVLKDIQTNNGGVRFGILANSALTGVTATEPAFQWKTKGPIAQGIGDFQARRLAAVTVSSNVQVLMLPNLASSTNATNLVFDASSAAAQSLQPGNVLVGGVGRGFLAKVISVSYQGALVSVQTAPATLQDVFTEGAFDESIKINPTTLLYEAPGVTFNTNKLSQGKLARATAAGLKDLIVNADLGQFTLNYDFDEVEIDQYVTLNGSVNLTLTPNLAFNFELLSGLQSFSTSVTGDLMADLEISVGDSLTNSADKVVWQAEGEPLFFLLGPVPLVVVPTLQLHAGYSASLEESMGMDASANASIVAGAQWTSPAGWSPIWTPSASFSADLNAPSVTATLEGYLRPEVVLQFDEVVGPDVHVQVGATLEAEAKVDPPEVCFSLTGNLDAGVGIELASIGNLNLSYEKNFAELNKTIFDTCDKFTVTTLPASDVTTNSATLNGEIYPGQANATAYFQWGTTTNYGNSTPIQDVPKGDRAVPLSFDLTGLDSNTNYYFRLVGTKGKETTNGIDQVFSTGTNASAAFGIGFDDLPTPTIDGGDAYYIGDIPDNYNGFIWNNVGVEDGITSAGSGYNAGTISPNNVAFNEYANPGSITSSSPFNLYSAYLTGAWNDGLQVEVQGYASGVLIYDNTYTLSSTSSRLVAFNYLGVDEVDFNSFGGEHNPSYQFYGEHFLMDNVVVATNAPPNSLANPEFAIKNSHSIPLTQRLKNGEIVFKPRPANSGSTGFSAN